MRGIWRGLYVERRTVGTHQVYGRTQASASLRKYFLLMLYWYWGPQACQHSFIFRCFNVVTKEDKFTMKPGSWKVSFIITGQQVSAGFWVAPSRLSFLTCAAHDLGWEVHKAVCIFLRAVMYRPTYGPPIRGFILPETSAAQIIYFFEENTEVCSIFLYKNRNAWSNLCFPSNYIIYI